MEATATQINIQQMEADRLRQSWKADRFCFYEALANHYLAHVSLCKALKYALEARRLEPNPVLDESIEIIARELFRGQQMQLGQQFEP